MKSVAVAFIFVVCCRRELLDECRKRDVLIAFGHHHEGLSILSLICHEVQEALGYLWRAESKRYNNLIQKLNSFHVTTKIAYHIPCDSVELCKSIWITNTNTETPLSILLSSSLWASKYLQYFHKCGSTYSSKCCNPNYDGSNNGCNRSHSGFRLLNFIILTASF